MTEDEALYQSLASCGAAVIAFIGVCHEGVGSTLFPWGPALFGGPVGWHGLGLACIGGGALMLGGTLRLIAFPVVPVALLVVGIGTGLVLFTAVAYGRFHMFALAVATAGVVAAVFHRKAVAERRRDNGGPR